MLDFSFVAIDLETTGLEETAEIIEIGLCKVEHGEITATLSHLVKPINIIPTDITLITGIDNHMVSDAPAWEDIQDEVLTFIGDEMLVAHNISFDRTILENHLGYQTPNLWADTHDFAKVFLPTLTSYKLVSIGQELAIESSLHHRALADAELCAKAFLIIMEKALTVGGFTLQKIANVFQGENNGFTQTLAWMVQYTLTHEMPAAPLTNDAVTDYINSSPAVSFQNAEVFFHSGGIMSKYRADFQYRPQQISMLRTITEAFQENKHAIIEAGTGTGKSFAYLVPSLLWAVENGTKVVISTNTIALQEQLYQTDLPFLRKALEYNFTAALSKGRSNYLCLRRLDLYQNQAKTMLWSEKIFLAQLYYWFQVYPGGDKETLNLNKLEQQYWSNISSQAETCLGNKCSYFKKCAFMTNRRKCEQSEIIITNHAQLLQDIKLDGSILPNYQHLIIDEAHHLEDEAIKQFTDTVDLELLRKSSKQLERSGNIINRILRKLHDIPIYTEIYTRINDTYTQMHDDIAALEKQISETITYVFTIKQLEKSNERRITPKERTSDWWQALSEYLSGCQNLTKTLYHRLTSVANYLDSTDAAEDLLKELNSTIAMFREQVNIFEDFLDGSAPKKVYWLEYNKSSWGNNLSLSVALIDIMPLLKEKLFDAKDTVVLTSATLAIRNDLNYTAESFLLKPEEYRSYITPSPFDYKKQSVIAIPVDNPDYSQTNEYAYADMVIRNLEKIIPSVTGGVLVLFTSYAMLNKVYFALKRNPDLSEYNILAHGQDGSRSSILHNLSNAEKTIVLGASSFWEGIDVKGSGLTTVVIVKLPFSPPTKPIDSAKLELLQASGKNGFMNYSLPQAILKFRQGCGRLIRTASDWGAVIILDNRVLTKSYGQDFLRSLPRQNILREDMDSICDKLGRWMQKKSAESQN